MNQIKKSEILKKSGCLKKSIICFVSFFFFLTSIIFAARNYHQNHFLTSTIILISFILLVINMNFSYNQYLTLLFIILGIYDTKQTTISNLTIISPIHCYLNNKNLKALHTPDGKVYAMQNDVLNGLKTGNNIVMVFIPTNNTPIAIKKV